MITSLSIALAGAVHAKRPFFSVTCKDEPALPRNVASHASNIEVEVHVTSLSPQTQERGVKFRGFTYENDEYFAGFSQNLAAN